jgi:hypothetical protein
LGDPDTLFVLAHGLKSTASEIAGRIGLFKRMATMTAPRLAAALEKDGLTKRFGDVRLLVCWGGYVGGETSWGKNKLKRKAAAAPFAGQLCSALKGRGYYRMILTGYIGSVGYVKPGLQQTRFNIVVMDASGHTKGQVEALNRSFDDQRVHRREKPVEAYDQLKRTYIKLDTDNRTVWY